MSLSELFPLVERTAAGRLRAHGCVSRELAHGSHAMSREDVRLPHPTAILLFVVMSKVPQIITHVRAGGRAVSGGRRDCMGGHVTYHPACLGSEAALEWLIDQTAVREMREEVLLARGGRPVLLPSEAVARWTDYGELICNDRSNPNFEYSTGYLIRLAPTDQFVVVDSRRDGTVEELPSRLDTLSDLEREFGANPEAFADGLSRVLKALSDHHGPAYKKFAELIS